MSEFVHAKVVNIVPVPAILADMYTGIKTSTFRTGLNTGHVPANFGQYWMVQKKVFFFFLSFIIFEFLLGQNGNLFALTY